MAAAAPIVAVPAVIVLSLVLAITVGAAMDDGDYDLSKLADFQLWIGAPGTALDFYYEAAIWQFSFTSRLEGIDADVDMNLQFYAPGADPACPTPEPSPSETPEPNESPEPAE